MTSPITRRQFLTVAAGAGLATLAVATSPWKALVGTTPPRSAAERLAGLLKHPESARPIGEAYLALAPHEASTARLVSLVAAGAAAESASDSELRRLVAAGVRDDFSAGRTAEVDGWVLSLTEARLFALVALS